MKLKKIVAALAMALPLSFAAVTAQAAVSTMVFEDDNIDFLLTPNTSTEPGVPALIPKLTGAFARGDVLFSVFEIPNYSIGGVDALPPGMELTGIAAIQIVDIIQGGPTGIGTQLIFAPYSGGLNYFLGNPVIQGGAGEGAMVAMYLNSAAGAANLDINFDTNPAGSCVSLANCIAEATAGSLLQVDGFAGDLDEFWSSVVTVAGGNDPSQVYAIGGGTGVAQFNAALTTFFNAPGTIAYQNIANVLCPAGSLAADGCFAGPTITGPITGGGGPIPLNAGIRADGAFARSDIDAVKLMEVPEPGTLALAGLSLLGLAAARRRRQK